MPDNELPDEDATAVEALVAEAEREAARVGVDWEAAAPAMRELAFRGAAVAEDDSQEVTLGLDVTGLLATLRALPDGAGTARFLAAFASGQASAEPPAA